MPKFENWSVVDDPGKVRRYRRPVEMLWRHDDKPFEVVILRESPEVMNKTGAKEFGVLKTRVIDSGSSFRSISKPRKFSSMSYAKENARNYMKNHPQPLVAGGGK